MGSCNSKPTAPENGEDVFVQQNVPSSNSQQAIETTSAFAIKKSTSSDEQPVSSKKIQRRSSSKSNNVKATTNPRTAANAASAPIPSSSSHSSRSNKQSSSSSSLVDSNTIDPRWSELFTSLHSSILDPEDLPATLDATISKTIDLLSPVEVSFIRRRVKYSIGAIVHNTEGNDVDIASSVGRSSLSKKMGRLLGKEAGDKSLSSSSSFYNNESTPSHHIHPALVEDSLIPYESRTKASKMVYQKQRLIDITIMRKIFEGGEQCLKHMQLQIKARRKGSVSKTSSPSRQQEKNNHDQISAVEDASRLTESLGNIDIYGSAYLLLMYMSETRWDYITEIARHSAKRAGLVLDVNKLALQEVEREREVDTRMRRENGRKNHSSRRLLSSSGVSIPSSAPIPTMISPAELYDNPDLTTNETGGIHFTSLCYLVALALRGTRRQKLNLLFHLLLPLKELDVLLSSHPAGLPTWLLEVDEDVLLSYDSLSYYYAYDGVMLPLERHASMGRMNVHKDVTTNGSIGKKKLCVDGASVVEILATILSGSSNAASTNTEIERDAYGIQRLSKKIDAEADHVKRHVSSVEQYTVSQMLNDEIGEDRTEPNLLFSENEKRSLNGFIERCHRVTSSSFGSTLWSMRDFTAWANVAIDETVLDKLMHNLFGTGIIPTAKLENTIVTQQWINWNSYQDSDVIDAGSEVGERQDESIVSNNYDYVWGGIGGIDGKGGLGHGVLYCIEKSWWDNWVAYTGWKAAECNGFNPTSLERPRELSTELLIDRSAEAISMSGTRGSYEYMKPKLSLGKDYVLIPPGVWNVLYELYGGGPPLPRMILPPRSNEGSTNGTHNGNIVSADDESVEVSSTMHNNDKRQYPRAIAKSIRVAIHPWIINCQICDPKQPYRRGDLGPMSIRVMAMPRQPLWRLFAEIVKRLPIILSKDPDSNNCEGRGRLWNIAYVNGKVPASRFGPWTLLCKNAYAEIPIGASNYDKYKYQWQSYCDKQSIESAGLLDGSRVMFEYVLPSKEGSFKWPREAAAKATHLRRIADEDTKFRILLRGYNADGIPSREPIIRKIVDAMDTTGRWYRGLIVKVERDTKTAEHNGSNGRKHKDASKEESFREITHVRIHFNDHHENHEEWIEVKSDRLAVAGRFTSNAGLESDSESDAATDTKSILPVSKKKDTTQSNDSNHNALCLFPSYGACGLINLGNTCYANSGWQCLSYMPLLRSYLLSEQYKFSGDMNRDNPLGTGGKILEEFADLMRIMWSAKFGARAPQRFRSLLTKCRPRYSGANQHDVPELLTDILDMIHEDANRVKKKPYVEALEDKFIEENDIQRIGQEAWCRYLRRNRSVITDLCMGQLFNLVKCPECKHASKNFDPFNVLSLPLPTVDEVIFRCTIVRRATELNCPSTLPLVSGLTKGKIQSISQLSPPSTELIFEEYAIPTSRLADLGDLKMKLEHLSGIPAKRLRLCKREKIETGIGERHSMTSIFTKVSCLPDKEGPCLRFLNHTSSDGSSSPIIATIVAFESTLQPRPEADHNDVNVAETDNTSTEDDTSSDTSSTETGGEDDAEANWKMIVKMGEECLEVYGDDNECLTYDTNPVPLAKYISHCQWPKKTTDFNLGLRVDAMDRRGNWYPGSVIEVVENESEDGHDTTTKVKVHFDNFSTKWDETYTIGSGSIRPLYSQSTPRAKPAEFVVHHRGMDHKTKKFFLFGQSFYLQCHNEWSTARAGAHLLAQASRFLETSHFKRPENGKKSSSVDRKIAEKERNNARKTIASIIQALIRSDKKYVVAAIEGSKQACQNGGYFGTASLSTNLAEKLKELLPFLPFDLRVTTADSPLGTNGEEVAYPFSLVRKIGNFMNARHSIVLHWRDNKVTNDSNVEREKQASSKQLLYIPPIIFPSKQNQKLLGTSGSDASKRNLNSSQGGFHIGSCLAKFFEEQHLEATGWRCPVCKEDREGKQSMSLWNLPDFLVFNFKRFNASSRWSEKITTRVDFPLTGLNMREWCDKQSPLSLQPSDEPFIYDLIGVVNHMGEIDTGHYIATCKASACSSDGNEEVAFNFNGSNTTIPESAGEEPTSSGWRIGKSKEKQSSTKAASKAVSESAEPLWLKFDDELVEPIPPRTVVTEAAYVLFYKRRQMRPSNIAKYSTMD